MTIDLEELAVKSLLLMMLGVSAVTDHRTGRINLIVLAAFAFAGFFVRVFIGDERAEHVLSGCVAGLVMLVLSYISREAVGYGDSMIVMASGFFLSWANGIILFIISLFLAAVTALALLAFGKKKGKDRLKFAPFMLTGYVFMLSVA